MNEMLKRDTRQRVSSYVCVPRFVLEIRKLLRRGARQGAEMCFFVGVLQGRTDFNPKYANCLGVVHTKVRNMYFFVGFLHAKVRKMYFFVGFMQGQPEFGLEMVLAFKFP